MAETITRAEAIAHRESNPASRDDMFTPAMPDPCAASWMALRLPLEAIALADRMPPKGKEVLGFVSAPEVAIHHIPLIVWWTGEFRPGQMMWWAGLPGSYLDLRRWQWTVTHWLPLADGTRRALAQGEAARG